MIGIGPDAPVIVTSGGGKHAASPYAFELVPAVALFEVARTLADGARKYGIDNWRGVPIADQLGHALQHVYGYLAGDISDDHLAHAACRILFALELAQDLDLDKHLGPRGAQEPTGTSGAGSSPAAGPSFTYDPATPGALPVFQSDEWRKDLDYLAPCLN